MGHYAFASSGIVSVTIPEAMDAVPYGAFSGCESLETVVLHSGVSEIGYYAFGSNRDNYNEKYSACINLKNIDLTNVKSLGEGAFFGSGLTEVTIPKAVTKIPESAFCACASLATVNLHDAVTSIGRDAFGSYSFYDSETGEEYTLSCSSLKNIDLPESLIVIYDNAFSDSAIEGELIEGTKIVALDIPAGVSDIRYGAFRGCMNLAAVKMNTSDVPEGENMFPSATVIYVPADAVETYKSSDWGYYTILPYDMMSVSLGLTVALGDEVTYSDGYFNAPMSVTVTGDDANLSNVDEYGYYVKILNRWGEAEMEYYPVDALNVATETTFTIYSEYVSSDYENHKAIVSANIGAYVRIDDDTVVTYSNTPVEVVYDKKPSVKFTDVTTSVDGSVNFELTYEVEGAYWIYNEQLNKEGNGYFSMSSVYIEDGVNTTSGSWDVYETPADGYIYFYYYDRNYVDYTSNFVHLSMDADSVVSAEIVDSME
ncbi:MAG: leucine-rich repeat domain-containing protein [Bacteroidales bacterium]|nr:leucine-rich repeat domain-containing protein [Bacteroidales bacterium]